MKRLDDILSGAGRILGAFFLLRELGGSAPSSEK